MVKVYISSYWKRNQSERNFNGYKCLTEEKSMEKKVKTIKHLFPHEKALEP